jgi:hypothetical protein
MSAWVTLMADDVADGHELAGMRRQSGIDRNRPAENGAPTQADEAMRLDLIGAMAEEAGYVYFRPVKWAKFISGRLNNEPDFHDFIEMKGRPQSWHELPIQRKGIPDRAYVLALGHNHPVWELVGWCWGHEGMRAEFLKDPAGGRPAYFVPQEIVRRRQMGELFEILRRRQTVT